MLSAPHLQGLSLEEGGPTSSRFDNREMAAPFEASTVLQRLYLRFHHFYLPSGPLVHLTKLYIEEIHDNEYYQQDLAYLPALPNLQKLRLKRFECNTNTVLHPFAAVTRSISSFVSDTIHLFYYSYMSCIACGYAIHQLSEKTIDYFVKHAILQVKVHYCISVCCEIRSGQASGTKRCL